MFTGAFFINVHFLVRTMISANCSILHLSDLHRDICSELGSDVLGESVIRDIHRFNHETPSIRRPDLCVVTGDVVYGVKKDHSDHASELDRQYKQADQLLVKLADELFDGDREKIILLPGNHDVCYNTASSSWSPIPTPPDIRKRRELIAELFAANSQIRWSWEDLCFYRINDLGRYSERFSRFSKFYNEFYQGKRSYSVLPDQQIGSFIYPEHGVAVLSLNSCFNNDPLRRSGGFSPECIATASQEVRKLRSQGYLLLAAWHHNFIGGPQADDYLDPDALWVLLDLGIKIGLHGHQHRSQVVSQHRRIGSDKHSITVISAGTLGGGVTQLAPGEARSYNVLELTNEGVACVHQRRMLNANFLQPVWSPGYFSESGGSSVEFEIPIFTPVVDSALELASKLIHKRNWARAIDVLRHFTHIPIARPLLAEAYRGLSDWNKLTSLLWPPESIPDAIDVGCAIIEASNAARAKDFLAHPFISNAKDPALTEVIARVRFAFKL